MASDRHVTHALSPLSAAIADSHVLVLANRAFETITSKKAVRTLCTANQTMESDYTDAHTPPRQEIDTLHTRAA